MPNDVRNAWSVQEKSARRVTLMPEALLSLPVFTLTSAWAIVVQFGEGTGRGEGISLIATRLILLIALQALMFAFPYLTWRAICPHVPANTWNLLLAISVVIGAAVRGAAFAVLLLLIGVTDSLDLTFRVVVSVSHMAVVTMILWFLVSEVRGLQSRRRQLVADRDQLVVLQQTVQHDLAQLGDRTVDAIRRSILESLGGLQASDSYELRQRLRVTIDEVVRPLSHQLAAQPPGWVAPKSVPESRRVDWLLTLREGLDPTRIHPLIVTILLLGLGIPFNYSRYGAQSAAWFAATSIVVIPAFWLLRRGAIRVTAHRGAGIKAVAFTVAVLLGGAALGLATLPYMHSQPRPLLFVTMAPIFALLISAPLAVAQAARDHNLELESDLRATTADLRWMLARAREQYRQRERALAHALHSRIQTSLAAAFLRLDSADAQGNADKELLESVQAEVLQVVSAFNLGDTEPDPIDKVISLTQRNWSGTVNVKVTIDPLAREALESDPLTARSVNDLIPELVFNSVRHGSARAIEVQLEISNFRTLSLTVIDDGSGDLAVTRYGLGSALLDEASLTWRRTRLDTCTMTTCLLPIIDPRMA